MWPIIGSRKVETGYQGPSNRRNVTVNYLGVMIASSGTSTNEGTNHESEQNSELIRPSRMEQ